MAAEYVDDDDDSGDDLLFAALAVGVGYFIFQFFRYREAASYGGGAFQPYAPAPDFTESALNYLVPLRLSPTGAAFIKQQEGFRANAYPDGGGQSIGYGHQISQGEHIVPPITRAEADSLFSGDVAEAEKAVGDSLLVQVSQSQFDALVDLAFNIGGGEFRKSTLLRLLNAGDYAGAAGQFSRWVHSGGKVNPDLVARREQDFSMFQTG